VLRRKPITGTAGDEQGGFFRRPIGHPALEIVAPDVEKSRVAKRELPIPPAARAVFPQDGGTRARMAEIIQQRKARQQCTAQLLRDNKQLRKHRGAHQPPGLARASGRLTILRFPTSQALGAGVGFASSKEKKEER
jgi:hypothetical protein